MATTDLSQDHTLPYLQKHHHLWSLLQRRVITFTKFSKKATSSWHIATFSPGHVLQERLRTTQCLQWCSNSHISWKIKWPNVCNSLPSRSPLFLKENNQYCTAFPPLFLPGLSITYNAGCPGVQLASLELCTGAEVNQGRFCSRIKAAHVISFSQG